MTRIKSAWMLALGMLIAPGVARSTDCSTLPTQFTGNEFPTGTFFSNFATSCYMISFATGNGLNGQAGDTNGIYNKIYFKVDPRYQLIVFGTFPNARYFSVMAYDEHAAYSRALSDINIVPLTSQYINPYQAGTPFLDGQKYAVAVDFGGTPGTIQTGCSTDAFNVDVNKLDATRRHDGMEWNTDQGLFKRNPAFPLHVVDTPQHTNPNRAGAMIVRDVASGCALPASYAVNTLQIVTSNATTGNTWLDGAEHQDHNLYENSYLPRLCFATDPQNSLAWLRGAQYVPGDTPDNSYINAFV